MVLAYFSCFVTVSGHVITFCDRNNRKIRSSVTVTEHEILDMIRGAVTRDMSSIHTGTVHLVLIRKKTFTTV